MRVPLTLNEYEKQTNKQKNLPLSSFSFITNIAILCSLRNAPKASISEWKMKDVMPDLICNRIRVDKEQFSSKHLAILWNYGGLSFIPIVCVLGYKHKWIHNTQMYI